MVPNIHMAMDMPGVDSRSPETVGNASMNDPSRPMSQWVYFYVTLRREVFLKSSEI